MDRRREKQSGKPIGIAYFYFVYDQQSKQNAADVAARLFKQLIYQLKIPSPALEGLYYKSKGGFPPKDSSIIDLLISYGQQYFSSIFVFLDALDECSSNEQESIIKLVETLSDAGIRVFLTSQSQLRYHIQKMKMFLEYEIWAKTDDFEEYINQRVGSDDDCSGELKVLLLKELIKDAGGM